jgi:hypothetical protein
LPTEGVILRASDQDARRICVKELLQDDIKASRNGATQRKPPKMNMAILSREKSMMRAGTSERTNMSGRT